MITVGVGDQELGLPSEGWGDGAKKEAFIKAGPGWQWPEGQGYRAPIVPSWTL